MSLLAAKSGADVVLKGCTVRPRDPAPPPPPPKKPGAKAAPAPPPAEPVMLVSVMGRGRSQQAVSQFVLRLESTGLFGRVTLVETNRDNSERVDAIGFRIDCSLDEPAGPRTERGGRWTAAEAPGLKKPAATAALPATKPVKPTPVAGPSKLPSLAMIPAAKSNAGGVPAPAPKAVVARPAAAAANGPTTRPSKPPSVPVTAPAAPAKAPQLGPTRADSQSPRGSVKP